jgi:hypothetical protein
MTGQHFKELVETICKTYKIPKTRIAAHLGISKYWLNQCERYGVSPKVKSMWMKNLRELYLAKLYNM